MGAASRVPFTPEAPKEGPSNSTAGRIPPRTCHGEDKAATVGIAHRNAQVVIRAYGLTYPSPTIAVTVTWRAGLACFK